MLIGDHLQMASDYLKDLYSFCFTGTGGLQYRWMDEFYSRTTPLNLKQRVRIRGLLCSSIG